MKATIATLLILSLTLPIPAAPLLRSKSRYIGGTWAGKEGAVGKLDWTNEELLVFTPDRKGAAALQIPYAEITSVEYGQKASRRIIEGIAAGVLTMGIGALAALSKTRKHYLSISYTVDGKNQAVVLELAKDLTRKALPSIQARWGHLITYESDEVRENAGQ